MQLIDTHVHLDFPRFNEDREKVIKRAEKNNVIKMVNVGANLASSRRSLELSQRYDNIYATVGIHPHDADKFQENTVEILKDLSKPDRVVAIGEIGLDFHYDNSPRETQKNVFIKQLKLAQDLNLPVVIHSRDAKNPTLKILKKHNVKNGILHCFAGDREMARKALDLGLYLAFGGIITFKNTEELYQVVKEIPLERILLETDSPYLSPVPRRGKRNEPAYVKFVAEKIAEIKNIELEKVAEVTTTNAEKIYNM